MNFARKIKYLVRKSRSVRLRVGYLSFSVILFLCNFQAKGQDPIPIPEISTDSIKAQSFQNDTLPKSEIVLDSLGNPIIINDSIQNLSTLSQGLTIFDSTQVEAPKPVGDITTTVKYSSSDSINMNVKTKVVKLYGKSNIDYQPIGLAAERIDIDWNTNNISAVGVEDSLGNIVGSPVFKNGMETYETDNMKYNFKTKKAVISGMVTQQGEGIIHGDKVYKNNKNELFMPNIKYTTCNLAHPHFYIAARNVKVIPGNKLVSGPFNMVVSDVPTPAGFFFGMFPEQSHKASGLIIPSYGEQKLKGFFLENGGYYLALSEYANLSLTGSIYSRGGYGINVRSQYVSRYKYAGNVNFDFTRQNLTSDAEVEPSITKDFRIAWGHTPKSSGTGRFTANVNASTSTYNRNNVLETINDQVNATLSSAVSYSKTFRGTPVSMGINTRFNQNLKTKQVDLLLPEFSANVKNIYPFQGKSGGSSNWLDRLTFRYTMNGLNKITNKISADSIAPFDLETIPKLFDAASKGIKHSIPVGTSLKAFKFFTISPALNYEELWYTSKLDHQYDSLTQTVVTDTIPGFQRIYSYNTSVSMNTRIFGTYFFNRPTGIQAIRHVLNPSIGYSYRPDFSEPRFDYYQEIQSNERGDSTTLSRYTGYIYGAPGVGRSSAVSLSLTNTLEMKVKNRNDTTNTSEKIPLLRNFGLSGSYNFAADSFNLSNISARATTSLFSNKKILKESATLSSININLNGTIDPYVWVLDSVGEDSNLEPVYYQRKIDKYAWNNGEGFGKFANVNFSLSSGIQANPRNKGGSKVNPYDINEMQDLLNSGTLTYQEEAIIKSLMDYPEQYVDFNIPWSLNFTYNVNLRNIGFAKGDVTQTVQFNGDFSLTPKWKLTYNAGFDIIKKEWTTSRLGLFRDMHCWEMNFSWVPFGRFTSYDFTIRAKSTLLQDLKINRRRAFQDNLF